jgi:hypothetical protein
LRVPEVGDVEETPSSMFYQEDTSTGSFTVEEDNDLDHNIGAGEADVIHDSSDVELLNKLSNMNTQEQGNEPPPSEISSDIDATKDDSDVEEFYDDTDDF